MTAKTITKTKTAMNTTHNTQLTTLNAKEYAPPVITVVEFKVEHCFGSSEEQTPLASLLGDKASRWDYNDCYSTGSSDITEYTSYEGEFSRGSWD